MRYTRAAAALLAGALVASAAAPALAAPPRFVWQSLAVTPAALPAGPAPFTVLARIAASDEIHYYTLALQGGTRETLAALVLHGAPPVELTVLAPDGSEFSLPSLPHPQSVWLGGIHLDRSIRYPYVAQVAGTYILAVQPGTPGADQPYALQGDPSGNGLLSTGGFGPLDVLRGPVTWLQSLLWLWG